MKKHIILIPFWVQEILNRNRMQLGDCLDFAALKPVMSLVDLVSFASLQHYLGFLTGQKEDTSTSLYFEWLRGIPEGNQDLIDYLNKTVTALEGDASIHDEVRARLFNAESKTYQYDTPFIIYDLTPAVAGVVIYPGFFGEGSDTALQLNLVRAMLKVLYVYETHSEVARTPLFKRYLELLSRKQIIV